MTLVFNINGRNLMRRCKFKISHVDEPENEHEGFFHQWIMIPKEFRDYNAEHDQCSTKTISTTAGLVEDIKTGRVYTVAPESITFKAIFAMVMILLSGGVI